MYSIYKRNFTYQLNTPLFFAALELNNAVAVESVSGCLLPTTSRSTIIKDARHGLESLFNMCLSTDQEAKAGVLGSAETAKEITS